MRSPRCRPLGLRLFGHCVDEPLDSQMIETSVTDTNPLRSMS
jgi:hypothetical protein